MCKKAKSQNQVILNVKIVVLQKPSKVQLKIPLIHVKLCVFTR